MKKYIILLCIISFVEESRAQLVNAAIPPNKPAIGSLKNGEFALVYAGKRILLAQSENPLIHLRVVENSIGEKVEQVLILESDNSNDFSLEGTITGSEEAFPCEVDYPRSGFAIVRHVVGLSNNLLNRAIYDRSQDWVISFDFPCPVLIKPIVSVSTSKENVFQFIVRAKKLSIRFRPRYYQLHKGLKYFEPWNYCVWNKSVTGWCSWFAFGNAVNEANIRIVADTLARTLLPYGYKYLQIDDGYQKEPIGIPNHWLVPNNKFPGGLEKLGQYIRAKGMEPGIWTNVSFADSGYAYQHQNLFVKNAAGNIAQGDWIGFVMDGSNPRTIIDLIEPVYAGLQKMGWTYFKVDALRHLKYEGYNSYKSYFDQKHINRDNTFRNLVKVIRKTAGKNSYLLGCWGIRPELIGVIDGCRIGNDGFSYAGLAQYNSFNNVVWRNDPDHVELTDQEAFRSCTVTSLTGSVLMLTDKPEHYKGRILEAARRTAPVLFTRPGQIYEVDPSRIQSLQRATSEVSGDGPRVFDASYSPITELYTLEINKMFDNWLVLGRLNDKTKDIPLNNLGLSNEQDYYVFEFWTQRFLGMANNHFSPPSIDSFYNCQAFCFRKREEHPQMLGTNRHISCGGLELLDCSWVENKLNGKSELVPNDEYKLFIHVPANFRFLKINTNAELLGSSINNDFLVVTIKSTTNILVDWSISFETK